MNKARVIVADAHYLVRYAIRSILEGAAAFEVIEEVDNEAELLKVVEAERPDLVIVDYAQPGYFSQITLQKLLTLVSAQHIMIISSDEDEQTIHQALELGIQTFITKSCDNEEVIDAAQAAVKGQKFFCNQVIDYLLEKSFSRTSSHESQVQPLTPREIQVVQLIAKGFIAKEISDILNLSTHTVYTHRKNIMRKLDLSSPSELILYAVKHGLVKSE